MLYIWLYVSGYCRLGSGLLQAWVRVQCCTWEAADLRVAPSTRKSGPSSVCEDPNGTTGCPGSGFYGFKDCRAGF